MSLILIATPASLYSGTLHLKKDYRESMVLTEVEEFQTIGLPVEISAKKLSEELFQKKVSSWIETNLDSNAWKPGIKNPTLSKDDIGTIIVVTKGNGHNRYTTSNETEVVFFVRNDKVYVYFSSGSSNNIWPIYCRPLQVEDKDFVESIRADLSMDQS